MIDEIGVVDAIDADLDRLPGDEGCLVLFVDRRVDAFVNVWLGMIRVIGLAFGEFGRQMQRIEMMIAPVDVPLQFLRRQALAFGTELADQTFKRRYVAVARSLVSKSPTHRKTRILAAMESTDCGDAAI